MADNAQNPAFPFHRSSLTDLTKREFVAGIAMQGILSNPEYIKVLMSSSYYDPANNNLSSLVAQDSVGFADAILKQLDKTT